MDIASKKRNLMAAQLGKFNKLVDALQELPTIGKKSATRLAYHILMKDTFVGMKISNAIEEALGSLKKCTSCGGMSEDELCFIFGIPQKPSDINGANVGQHYIDGNYEKIIEYNNSDVETVRKLFNKMNQV